MILSDLFLLLSFILLPCAGYWLGYYEGKDVERKRIKRWLHQHFDYIEKR